MNRIAVVTGANRGIGREVARQLADVGDTIYLTARNLVDADAAVADLGSPANLHSHQLDVTDGGSIDRLAATIEADMGGRGGGPVADGAAAIVWAADLPDSGPTGGFFYDTPLAPW
jgi:NAD(P)-dependent dehydrogenase (short-subunit alcohol dehydrogenase family)